MKGRFIATSLGFLAALACQRDDDQQVGPAGVGGEVRDSVGVRIVESVPPPEDSPLAWTLAPEPTVSIGVLEGDDPYLLDRVVDAMRAADGRIVVANQGTHELRVYDAEGIWLESWGGQGQGPGEFEGLIAVEPWPGDSIAAWYGPQRGISVFDAEGNFGRNVTLEPSRDDPGASFVQPIAVRTDGTILAGHNPHVLDPVRVELRDAEGRVAGSLGEHAGHERHLVEEGPDRVVAYEPVFGAKAVQLAWGDLVVHSLDNRYEIRAFAGDGTLARIVRWGDLPRPPTGEQINAWIEDRTCEVPWWVTPGEIEEYREERRREYRSVPVAEHLPAFGAAMVDRMGRLWVEDYRVPGDCGPGPGLGSLWTVFGVDGRLLGRGRLPASPSEGMRLFEIGADYVLVLARDPEFGVERVEMWEMESR